MRSCGFILHIILITGCQAVLPLRKNSPVLPPYMLNLYNRLKEDRTIPHRTSNTIRSFLPVPGNFGERKVLVFNLSGVHQSEYIDKSDLHLRWNRELPSGGNYWKTQKLRLLMLNLKHPSRPEIQISPVIRRSSWGGWQTLDVTDAVISCLEDDSGENHLLGLAVDQEKDETLGHREIEDFFSSSFLVIFSEDDDHLAIGGLRYKIHQRFSRKKRDFLDNQLTNNHLEIINGDGSGIQPRMKYKPLEFTPSSRQPKGRKKKRRENRRKERRSMELKWRRSWWKDTPQVGDEGDEEDAAGARPVLQAGCQRKSLLVDFAKIGWNDWIIAPKRFDAYLCAGDCTSPLAENRKDTNYATLRALLDRSSGDSSTALCCVPQSMSAVPMLFYDENENVVLKKFPAMRVESCSCR